MADTQAERAAINQAEAQDSLSDLRNTVARGIAAPIGFRERLADFWANHFAVDGRGGHFRFVRAAYIEDAIRPHLVGTFATLLRAAVTHPVMQGYLNQNVSVGPFSLVGRRSGRGVNENLARELLELHHAGRGLFPSRCGGGGGTQMARLFDRRDLRSGPRL